MRNDGEVKDVLIVGGGPAGLSAALVLGRGMKKVVLCDAGPPRNAAADHMQGFVTHDGTPPTEFRRIGREQLRPYDVELRETRVEHIERTGAGFDVTLGDGATVRARRVLLATGMIDEHPPLPGWRELWGSRIFQCPYCHGWEVRERAWGVLATSELMLEFSIFLTGWTRDVVAFTEGKTAIPPELRARLSAAGVRVEERPVTALVPRAAQDGVAELEAIVLADGARVRRDVLLARPPQRQVDVVTRLGLELDEQGFVRVNEQKQTSVPGISAAGDLTTPVQGALLAAAAGATAAYVMNHGLNVERAGTLHHP